MAIGIAMMNENGIAIAFSVTKDKNMYVLAMGECDTDAKVIELSNKASASLDDYLKKGDVKEEDFLTGDELYKLQEGI